MNKSENESKYWVACGALWVAFSILLGAAGKHILMADCAEIRAENLNTASQFGMIMGLSNTAATIPGIIGVYISGVILESTGSWALVFQTAAGVLAFGLVFYLIFASSKKLFD